MKLSFEERILIGIAFFMCAVIICFNAFDSAYLGKALVNTATPINHTISSEADTAQSDTFEDVQSQTENIEKVIPSYTEPETVRNNSIKVINLNTATESELKDFLPGIGDVKAKAIVDYREKSGGFSSVSELLNVKGIGNKTYENIRDLCIIE